MANNTPTPWRVGPDNVDPFYISAPDKGVTAFVGVVPIPVQTGRDETENRANAEFIVTAVNNHAQMIKSLELCATLFDGLAVKLDRWATQSQTGGWSTHQVDENIKTAADCRRYAATIRRAFP